MFGLLLTTWTIRLALACYVAWLARALMFGNSRQTAASRWLWTAGCGLFVVHVLCAFHFHHGWSHAAAWEKTAHETKELLGVEFGNGIYFSYLYLAVWVLDVAGLWRGHLALVRAEPGKAVRYGTTPLRLVVHAYLFFIAFNGAIVFESGPVRWAGIVACLALTGLALRHAYTSLRPSRHPSCELVH
jgi:hypothetical protein